MRYEFRSTTRQMLALSGLVLAAGAVAVSLLAFRAAKVEKVDPNSEIAALATSRASLAAADLETELLAIGGLLDSLAKSGGARSGNPKAMRFASRAFSRTKGLEQLAVYGPDGKTRWVMRPASRGRVLFPPKDDFIAAHLASADLPLRLAEPFQPSRRSRYWTPVSRYVQGKNRRDTALLVAFVRTEIFDKALATAGEATALYTDSGVLAAAMPREGAPVGASFEASPTFLQAGDAIAKSGAFLANAETGPPPHNVVAFKKLDCCGAMVTTVAEAAPPAPLDPKPIGRWLAIAAASLMILMALTLIARKLFKEEPADPWQDFGRDRPQPSA